ncbi:MAG: hypothetical protein MJK08_03975 [Campylobacterales bacterium]|nr:hypothetical protein [Campylobacterales bacterium]
MDELDVFGEISPSQLEFYAKVKIDTLNIKKDLAKQKENLLNYGVSWIRVGTRSLANLPYPDSFPTEIAGGAIAIFLTINKIAKVLLTQTERALTYFDLEFIHQQFAFEDNSNIGFTKAYTENYNKDSNGDNYGQLQSEAQMAKPLIDTSTINEEEYNNKSAEDKLQEDLDKYSWDKIYCDEDTIKEAMYLVINKDRYSVTDEIYEMNKIDLEREKLKTKEDTDSTFTKINYLTPEKGIRYDLLSNNCQSFVKKVFSKYKELEKVARKKEELGIKEYD